MRFLALGMLLFFSACSPRIYIVRHAEKAPAGPNMISDVPLSVVGQQRADDLLEELKSKKIKYVYSTQTVRTISTATPTADFFGLPIEIYNPRPDSAFVQKIKSLKKNTLIVGHSNTVDDLVNMISGQNAIPGDLPDTEYDNLFIIKGRKVIFGKFGARGE